MNETKELKPRKSLHDRLSEASILGDGSIKFIFDHVRNIGIAALVGASASYWHKHPTTDPKWYSDGSIAMLGVISFLLFVLNFMHGLRKIGEAGLPSKLLWLFGVFIYLPSVGLFLQQLNFR